MATDEWKTFAKGWNGWGPLPLCTPSHPSWVIKNIGNCMKPRHLSGTCGGSCSVDSCVAHPRPAPSQHGRLSHCSPAWPNLPPASTHQAHLYPCSCWSCFITHSTANGYIHSYSRASDHDCYPDPRQSRQAFHRNKDREETICVRGMSSALSPACPCLTQARPVPNSCPCVGKARRGLIQKAPEVWRVLCWVSRDAAVSKGCSWKDGIAPGVHPQGRTVKWVLEHWLRGSNHSRGTARVQVHGGNAPLGCQQEACAQPLSTLTQDSAQIMYNHKYGPQLAYKGHRRPLVKQAT